MKKKTAILLSVILLFGCAYADSEISFQKIPWLSSETEVIQSLIESGLIQTGADIAFSHDEAFYPVPTDEDLVLPDSIQELKDVCLSIDLKDSVKGRMAGYPIKGLTLVFAYDGTYKLISVKVDLINADYESIKEKLTRVYGDGECAVTEEFVESNIWKGDNNSAVLLYSDSDGAEFILLYGRLDAQEILANCLVTDPDDVSGL